MAHDDILYDKITSELVYCPQQKKSANIDIDTKSISSTAFNNCSLLTTLYIPANINNINNHTFDGCTSLESFTIDSKNENYSVKDDILYDKAEKELIKCPANKASFTLNSLPNIQHNALDDYRNTLTISLVHADKPFITNYSMPNLPSNEKTQLNYIRTLKKGELGAIMLFFIPDNADDFCFYELDSEDSSHLMFKHIPKNKLECAKPYLYKNADDDNIVSIMTKSNAKINDVSTYSNIYSIPKTENWEIEGTYSSCDMYGRNHFVLSDYSFVNAYGHSSLSPFDVYIREFGISNA